MGNAASSRSWVTWGIGIAISFVVAVVAALFFYPWRLPYRVTGRVVDSAGRPVPNAYVFVSESTSFFPYTHTAYEKSTSVRAGADGVFTFSGRGYDSVSFLANSPDGVLRSGSVSVRGTGTHSGLRITVRTNEEANKIGTSVGWDSPTAHEAIRAAVRAAATRSAATTGPATRPALLPWGRAERAETERLGDLVILLLERHKGTKWRYPATLAEAADAPTLEALAPRIGSGVWQYRAARDGKSFILWVDNGPMPAEQRSLYSSALDPSKEYSPRVWHLDE